MEKIAKDMGVMTKSLDKAMASMDLMEVSNATIDLRVASVRVFSRSVYHHQLISDNCRHGQVWTPSSWAILPLSAAAVVVYRNHSLSLVHFALNPLLFAFVLKLVCWARHQDWCYGLCYECCYGYIRTRRPNWGPHQAGTRHLYLATVGTFDHANSLSLCFPFGKVAEENNIEVMTQLETAKVGSGLPTKESSKTLRAEEEDDLKRRLAELRNL
jgi:hypothetical protein